MRSNAKCLYVHGILGSFWESVRSRRSSRDDGEYEEMEEKEFLPRLDFSRVMNPNDPPKSGKGLGNRYFSFEDKNLFPLGNRS